MAEILRTWVCGHCSQRFDAWEANPECPSCGCVRVQWVPGGGHIMGSAPGIDAEFRSLADLHGLTNLKSGGGGAKPLATQPQVDQRGQPHQFAPGFACVPDASRPMCVPSTAGMTHNAKVTIGAPLRPNGTFPSPMANTTIEAAHRPKPS